MIIPWSADLFSLDSFLVKSWLLNRPAVFFPEEPVLKWKLGLRRIFQSQSWLLVIQTRAGSAQFKTIGSRVEIYMFVKIKNHVKASGGAFVTMAGEGNREYCSFKIKRLTRLKQWIAKRDVGALWILVDDLIVTIVDSFDSNHVILIVIAGYRALLWNSILLQGSFH